MSEVYYRRPRGAWTEFVLGRMAMAMAMTITRAITGELFIGAERVATRETFQAVNPASNAPLEPRFSDAGVANVEAACRLAATAFDVYGQASSIARARLLETI